MPTFDHLLYGHFMNSPLWLVIRGCCCLSLPIWTRGWPVLARQCLLSCKGHLWHLLDSSVQLLGRTAVQSSRTVCVMNNVACWVMCFWLFRRGHLLRRTSWGRISSKAIIRYSNCFLWCTKRFKAVLLQSKSKLPEHCGGFASCIMKSSSKSQYTLMQWSCWSFEFGCRVIYLPFLFSFVPLWGFF